MKQNIEINLKGDQKELILREGDASPVEVPQQIALSGGIQNPARFHAIRPGTPKESLVVFSRAQKMITFFENPEKQYCARIEGCLLENEDLKAFGINDKMWGVQDLARFLKMNKVFFSDRDEAEGIITKLTSLRATTTTDIEMEKDDRGNSRSLKDKKTVSNVPLEFILKIPIYVGYAPKTFLVEIAIDSTDGGMRLWLESPELRELSISERDRIIDEEIEKFEGLIIMEG
jgi:hypothetical protein